MNPVSQDVVIAGSGMAGHAAAIYTGRADLNPTVIAGDEPGGQLTLTTDVENYLGFPDGINGTELVKRGQSQAERFGAEYRSVVVTDADLERRPFTLSLSDGTNLRTRSLIVATGASARTLGLPNEDKLMGHGLSTCATCDGAFHRDETVLVVGGGDSAMEEALFLTKFADQVYVAHRRDELRASEIMQERAFENPDIEFLWSSEVTQINGTPETGVTGVELVTHSDGRPKAKYDKDDPTVERYRFGIDCTGVFYAIGHTPNTQFLENTLVSLTDRGYIETKSGTTKTHVSGVFAAGDVTDPHYQQAITAAGTGSMAALDAEEWLEKEAMATQA